MTAVIDKLLAGMRKQFGESAKISVASDLQGTRTFGSSGSLALDFALGNGGWPTNRVVEICGSEHVGKTSLALLTMRSFLLAQPERCALLLDCEHKSDVDWVAAMVGEELMGRVIIMQPLHIEQATDMYTSAVAGDPAKGIPSGLFSIAVLDSIGGAPSMQSVNKSAEIATFGGNAIGVGRFARLAASHSNIFNCLAAETPVITDKGVRAIGDLAGSIHRVLTAGGNWVEAPFKEFGVQPLMRVTLERNGRRREFYATSGHRWFIDRQRTKRLYVHGSLSWDDIDKIRDLHAQGELTQRDIAGRFGVSQTAISRIINRTRWTDEQRARDAVDGDLGTIKKTELTTGELQAGMRLTAAYGRNLIRDGVSPSPFGIARGMTFGDGSRMGRGCVVDLFGKKDANMLPYFLGCRSYRYDRKGYNVESVRVVDLPGYFKDRPPLHESPAYLYGWLAGYFAADGNVNTQGQVGLTSVERANLEHVEAICRLLGIHTADISTHSGEVTLPQGGRREVTYHTLRLDPYSLSEAFFCIPEHRERWHQRMQMPNRRVEHWTVVAIEETDRVEEVYCAVVPETESFALDGNILTGNCLTIGINQVREDMAGLHRVIRPGGLAWKHAIAQSVVLKRGQGKLNETINGEEIQVGQEIKAKIIKNGLAVPGRVASWWFFNMPTTNHMFGIDTLEEIVRLSVLAGVVERRGGWYHHPALSGGRILGKDKLEAAIRDDTALYATLRSEVMARLGDVADQVAPITDPEAPIDDTPMIRPIGDLSE